MHTLIRRKFFRHAELNLGVNLNPSKLNLQNRKRNIRANVNRDRDLNLDVIIAKIGLKKRRKIKKYYFSGKILTQKARKDDTPSRSEIKHFVLPCQSPRNAALATRTQKINVALSQTPYFFLLPPRRSLALSLPPCPLARTLWWRLGLDFCIF